MSDYHEDNASFLIYKEWEELFESLDSMEEAGELIMALFAFAKRGEIAEFRGALKMAFIMMSNQLERDGVKWERNRQKNIENINKRWQKHKEQTLQMNTDDTTVYDGIRTDTNDTVKVKVKDKVKEEVKDNNGQMTIEQDKPVRVSSAEFEKLWSLYPRKEGKKEAMAAYQRAIKHGTTTETIEEGINRYNKHIRDCRIEKRYIKKGSTYFNQESWNDVYDDAEPTATGKKSSYDLSKVIPAIPVN